MAKNRNGYCTQVLLVEDDANTLHTMRDFLARANFRTRTAANGWEALKRIHESTPDIIIAKHDISDMDGSNLREKCLLNPNTREVPFLFLTQEDQPDAQISALRSGVDDCIQKPFDPVVLVARVQAVLERRQAFEAMVRIDPLTRMLNRTTFERELKDELARLVRYQREAALLVLDIDNLREVRDESGLALGDLLITCLSGVILSSIRQMDIAGRLRGEQFLLFLPETPADGAQILSARMQEKMAAIAESVAGYKLTFSAGFVTAPDGGSDYHSLVGNAFAALARAKEEGGGKTVEWQPGMTLPSEAE